MEKELQIVEDLSTFISELAFDENEINVEVSGKTVYVENKSESNLSNVFKNIRVDSLDIFEMEVEFNFVRFSEDGGLGLLLGWDGQFTNGLPDNCLRLLIEPTGKFSIDYFYDQHKELIAVEQSEFINHGAAANKITVQKNGNEIHFFANDNLFFTLQEIALAGTQFGFIVGPLTSISISSFYFASPETAGFTGMVEEEQLHVEEKDGPWDIQNFPGDDLGQQPVKKRSKFRIFLIVLLLLAWAIGFFMYRASGLIHILLIIAVLLMSIRRKR